MFFNACCCGCNIIGDTTSLSDWDQRAGSWTMVAGNLQTSSADAVAIRNDSVTGDDLDNGIVVTVSLSLSSLPKRRVIVCWLDDNNYLYAQFYADTTVAEIRLFSVSGGVTTQLGDTIIPENAAANGAQFAHVFQVCYRTPTSDPTDYNFSATWTTPPGGSANYYAHAVGPGTKVGVGNVSGSARFDTFEVAHALTTESPTCPTCLTSEACQGCCQYDTLPKEVQITLTGVPSGGLCNCTDLNSTFIMARGTNCHFYLSFSVFCPALGFSLQYQFIAFLTQVSPTVCRWNFWITEQQLPSGSVWLIVEATKDFTKPFACHDSFTFSTVTFDSVHAICQLGGLTFNLVPVSDP